MRKLEFKGPAASPNTFATAPIRDRIVAGGGRLDPITGAALAGFGFRLALARAAD